MRVRACVRVRVHALLMCVCVCARACILELILQCALVNGIDFDVYDIITPPLGPNNSFLMYTDALVINKALQTTTILRDIDVFMNFYSRLNTRLSIAFGDDLPMPHPPRYLMQARNDLYYSASDK